MELITSGNGTITFDPAGTMRITKGMGTIDFMLNDNTIRIRAGQQVTLGASGNGAGMRMNYNFQEGVESVSTIEMNTGSSAFSLDFSGGSSGNDPLCVIGQDNYRTGEVAGYDYGDTGYKMYFNLNHSEATFTLRPEGSSLLLKISVQGEDVSCGEQVPPLDLPYCHTS